MHDMKNRMQNMTLVALNFAPFQQGLSAIRNIRHGISFSVPE